MVQSSRQFLFLMACWSWYLGRKREQQSSSGEMRSKGYGERHADTESKGRTTRRRYGALGL